MRVEWKSCLRVGVSAFLLYLAIRYWSGMANWMVVALNAAFPLALGGVIAYIANILMSFYERKIRCSKPLWTKVKRPTCMLLAFVTVLAAMLLLIQLIIPQLISCFGVLINALPGAIEAFYHWLEENFGIGTWLEAQFQELPASSEDWAEVLKKLKDVLISGVGGAMNTVVAVTATVVESVITMLMSVIFAVYLLLGKEKLGGQFHRLLKRMLGERHCASVISVLRIADECFHHYIVGQCIEAVILGSLCAVSMLLMRLPYALMIGALVGVTALIPIAGAYIGAAVGAVMIFSVSPMQSAIFLVLLVIVQQIEGNLIYPRTVGASLGLPAIWVLAAVNIGGSVMGILGMIVCVPLAAMIYRLAGSYVRTGKIVEEASANDGMGTSEGE